MAFDPSIISQIPDMAGNPVAAKEQAYKLSDMATGAESNKLALGQQKQQIEDTTKARNILKGVKLDSPQDVTRAAEKLTNAGLPDEAMKFMKAMQGLQESKGNLTLQQYQLMGAKNDIIGGAVASLVGQADQMIQSGASPALVNAVMQPKYQQAIQQLSQAKLPDGSPALGPEDLKQIQQNPQFNLQFLRTIADRSKQGAAALQAQMKFHADERADKIAGIRAEAEKRMEQDERRKIMLAEETLRENREKDARLRAGIPEPMSQELLDTVAGPLYMADANQMSKFSTNSPKDPRKGQLNEWVKDKLNASGMKWQDLERLRQNFKAEGKSIDKLVPQLNAIESFEGEVRGNGERVLELIDMVDDTHVPLAEGFLRSSKRKLGGVDASELGSVLNSFQTQVARIIAGNPNMAGVVTDSARKDLQSIAPQSMNADTAKRIVKRLFTEADLRTDMIKLQINKAQDHSMESTQYSIPQRNPDGSLKTPAPQAAAGPAAAPAAQSGVPPGGAPAPPSGTTQAGASAGPPGLPPGFVVDK